jgi:prepilin-type processing-associated H-X9-DG protein/prepilin-type N-terminal cleavage/methylation domain-containing protein
MKRVNERSSGGFTLVELLVVIGIIAVLISVLLPALSKARKQAQAVTCLSQLKQIGLGMSLYAQANRDFMPYAKFNPTATDKVNYSDAFSNSTDSTKPVFHWFSAVSKYMGKESKVDTNITASDVGLADTVARVLKSCPDWASQEITERTSTTGYGMNVYAFRPKNDNLTTFHIFRPIKQSQLRPASEIVLISDSDNWLLYVTSSGTSTRKSGSPWFPPNTSTASQINTLRYSAGSPFRHGKNANYLFCDGSARAIGEVEAIDLLKLSNRLR